MTANFWPDQYYRVFQFLLLLNQFIVLNYRSTTLCLAVPQSVISVCPWAHIYLTCHRSPDEGREALAHGDQSEGIGQFMETYQFHHQNGPQ